MHKSKSPQHLFARATMDSAQDESDGLTIVDEEVADMESDFLPLDRQEFEDLLMCFFCQREPRMKHQIYGEECQADVKGARRDAASQGTASKVAFQQTWKRKGEELKLAIATYKTRCRGFGRGKARGSFQWCQFQMCIDYRSRMSAGRKLVEMTKGAWMHKWCLDNIKDIKTDRMEAEDAWLVHLDSCDQRLVSPCKMKVWTPAARFVLQENERSQAEQLVYGQKQSSLIILYSLWLLSF